MSSGSGLLVASARPSNVGLFWRRISICRRRGNCSLSLSLSLVSYLSPCRAPGQRSKVRKCQPVTSCKTKKKEKEKTEQENRRPFRICADEQLHETVSQQRKHQTRKPRKKFDRWRPGQSGLPPIHRHANYYYIYLATAPLADIVQVLSCFQTVYSCLKPNLVRAPIKNLLKNRIIE